MSNDNGLVDEYEKLERLKKEIEAKENELKKRIKDEAMKCLKEELKEPHFSDVKFPNEAIFHFLDETMNEIGIE